MTTENALTEKRRSLLQQGVRVAFKWHGSSNIYLGRIEVKDGVLYFCQESSYKGNKLRSSCKCLQYYNKIDDFAPFTYFEVIIKLK